MENVFFRQTLRGFDRRQVLEYIDNLSAQMTRQADDYTNIQKGLEAEIRSLSKRLSENKESMDISLDLSVKLQEELAEIKQDNFELKKQINTYRSMILERDREISEIKVNYNKLSEHKNQLEEENAGWKARQDEIAACMVEANLRAKKIINRAAEEARQKKAEFDSNARNLMDKVADVKGEISRLEQQLEESFARLSQAMEKMDHASAIIEAQVKEYRTQVDTLDDFSEIMPEETPVRQARPQQAQPHQAQPQPKLLQQPKVKTVAKKSLTDSVLDTISRLLEK